MFGRQLFRAGAVVSDAGGVHFRVERTRPDEWAAYRDLRLRALLQAPHAFASTHARELGFPASLWRERLATNLTFGASVEDGELVGTATGLRVSPAELHVVAMYVAPPARRSGCACALLDALVDAARERAVGHLVLEVTAPNLAAAACYRAYGFVPTGRTTPLERDPAVLETELSYVVGPPAPAEDPRTVGRPV